MYPATIVEWLPTNRKPVTSIGDLLRKTMSFPTLGQGKCLNQWLAQPFLSKTHRNGHSRRSLVAGHFASSSPGPRSNTSTTASMRTTSRISFRLCVSREPDPYCGWLRNPLRHHFDTMVETIFCWYLQGNKSSFQGVLGGAGFRPPTVLASLD